MIYRTDCETDNDNLNGFHIIIASVHTYKIERKQNIIIIKTVEHTSK